MRPRHARTDLLVVQSTPFCNIDCGYCYPPDRTNRARLSPEVAEAVFRRLFEFPTIEDRITIVWHAGEPLALPIAYYDSMFRLIRALAPAGLRVRHSLQTNGTLLSPGWCDLIEEWGVNVGVSVDGPRAIHDRHRKTRNGGGSFDRAYRGLRPLQDRGIPLHVITVLTLESMACPDELFAFYRDAGIGYVCFNIEEQEGANRSRLVAAGGAPALYRTFLRRFLDLALRADPPIAVRELEEALRGIRGGRFAAAAMAARGGNSQVRPFGIVSVDCYGNLSTFSPELLGLRHPGYGAFTFGNLVRDDFDAIAARVAESRLSADVALGAERCRDSCGFFGLCGGGAPSNKIYEAGTAACTETEYCRTQQAAIEVALDLIEASPAAMACA